MGIGMLALLGIGALALGKRGGGLTPSADPSKPGLACNCFQVPYRSNDPGVVQAAVMPWRVPCPPGVACGTYLDANGQPSSQSNYTAPQGGLIDPAQEAILAKVGIEQAYTWDLNRLKNLQDQPSNLKAWVPDYLLNALNAFPHYTAEVQARITELYKMRDGMLAPSANQVGPTPSSLLTNQATADATAVRNAYEEDLRRLIADPVRNWPPFYLGQLKTSSPWLAQECVDRMGVLAGSRAELLNSMGVNSAGDSIATQSTLPAVSGEPIMAGNPNATVLAMANRSTTAQLVAAPPAPTGASAGTGAKFTLAAFRRYR